MEVIIERACGMGIHKDSITACIMTSEGKVIQTFSTKTVFLFATWMANRRVYLGTRLFLLKGHFVE